MHMTDNLKTLLEFYIEAGVDEVTGDEPVDRFALSPAGIPKAPLKRSALQRAPTQTEKPKASVSIPNNMAVAEATELVGKCKSIEELQQALNSFEGCSLKKLATTTVFSRGNINADLMVIDRPPSSDEDRIGNPFLGRSGTLLEKMLSSIGLNDGDFYLASILPWRPPGGRTPTQEEQAICMPFIRRHIELANPKALLLCGEAAAPLLEKKSGINRLRGQWTELSFGNISVPALPIFHPAFLLDHPASKKLAWTDLLKLKAALKQEA